MGNKCSFSNLLYANNNYYLCTVKRHFFHEKMELKFTDEHLPGRTNDDVTAVKFSMCVLQSVPQGLTKLFPNLQALYIEYSGLESLKKEDLTEYKNIEIFSCEGNQLDFLPGDLFHEFWNLKIVSFRFNRLKLIEPNIFDELDGLEMVDLRKNSEYDLIYSTHDTEQQKVTLEAMKSQLVQKCPPFYQNLLSINQSLNKRNQELLVKIGEQDVQLEALNRSIVELTQLSCSSKGCEVKTFIQKDEFFKDFTVNVDTTQFQVHKLLLAARSPTLAEMLRNNPQAENLNLVDISVDIFDLILKFLYTEKLPVDDCDYLKLFAAAGQLKIEELKNYAAEKFYENVNSQNALEVLNLGNKYRHDGLRQKAFEEVKRKYQKIEFKDEWSEQTEKIVRIIEGFKLKEEEMRKVEERFQQMMSE